MKYIFSIFKITFFLCAAISLFSCKREIVYEGPKGELDGRVILGSLVANHADYSGILVTVDGTSPLMKAQTDSDGYFAIKNLTTGIYDLVFSKDSFATHKMVSYQFIGGNVPVQAGLVSLNKLPYATISNLKIDTGRYSSFTGYVRASANLAGEVNLSLRYYVSDSSNVSFSNYQATSMDYPGNSSSLSFSLDNNLLSKFPKNKKLYIIFYPAAWTTNSYTDMTTGNQIYEVNVPYASAVVPFTIPNTTY